MQLGAPEPELAALLFKALGVLAAEREALLAVALERAHLQIGLRAELEL